MAIPEALKGKATIPLWPEAGQIVGLSKNSTYAAARAGELPTLRMGQKWLVPVGPLLVLLGIADND